MIDFLKKLFHGKRIVYGTDYLTRFYLKGDGSGKSWELYLHRIYQEDGARKPHNHPWPWFLSIILSGWYVEERDGFNAPAGVKPPWFVRRWINWMPSPAVFHRITVVSNRPVWTLVLVPAKTERQWGFLIRDEQGEPTFKRYSEMTLDDGVRVDHF